MTSAAKFAESRNVTFRPPSAEFEPAPGDQALLVRAFQALLETAVRFSTDGETVRLSGEILSGFTQRSDRKPW
jgi:hypothetical protein